MKNIVPLLQIIFLIKLETFLYNIYISFIFQSNGVYEHIQIKALMKCCSTKSLSLKMPNRFRNFQMGLLSPLLCQIYLSQTKGMKQGLKNSGIAHKQTTRLRDQEKNRLCGCMFGLWLAVVQRNIPKDQQTDRQGDCMVACLVFG